MCVRVRVCACVCTFRVHSVRDVVARARAAVLPPIHSFPFSFCFCLFLAVSLPSFSLQIYLSVGSLGRGGIGARPAGRSRTTRSQMGPRRRRPRVGRNPNRCLHVLLCSRIAVRFRRTIQTTLLCNGSELGASPPPIAQTTQMNHIFIELSFALRHCRAQQRKGLNLRGVIPSAPCCR